MTNSHTFFVGAATGFLAGVILGLSSCAPNDAAPTCEPTTVTYTGLEVTP